MQTRLVNAAATALDLASGRYPDFVYGRDCGRVPVFRMHGVEHDLFRRQLAFLAENGYRTLTTTDFHEMLDDVHGMEQRSVMLTFDDGWGSLWSIGLPLLKEYGFKIVVFLAAGRITDGPCGRNLEDSGERGSDSEDVFLRDWSKTPLLTWDEVVRMHETGLVDFQSHTLNHTRIFRTDRVVDFVNPAMLESSAFLQIPEWSPGIEALRRLGRPIYESASRMSDHLRYMEDDGLRHLCEHHVEENGGMEFFKSPDWRKQLSRLVTWYHTYRPDLSRYETREERRMALFAEFCESRRVIEEHLPGKRVRHLSYPWQICSKSAIELSAEAGYITNFVGKLSGQYTGIRQGKPNMIARVGGDLFFRLPGKGREPLSSVLLHKLFPRTGTLEMNG